MLKQKKIKKIKPLRIKIKTQSSDDQKISILNRLSKKTHVLIKNGKKLKTHIHEKLSVGLQFMQIPRVVGLSLLIISILLIGGTYVGSELFANKDVNLKLLHSSAVIEDEFVVSDKEIIKDEMLTTTTYSEDNISTGYQAVMLINGNMFFGKLNIEKYYDFYELRDVFYLNVVNKGADKKGNIRQDATLIKRGFELYSPEDVMYINKDQVLFYENIQPNSKIIKGMQDYRVKQGKK